MKKYNIIIIILFFIFTAYSLFNIKETNFTSMQTLLTFSKTILPALLPFLILNQLLIKLGIIDFLAYIFQYISYPLFKISGKGASIIILGILNGFPSSAIYTSLMLMNKQIHKEEAQRLINFIFFPSISFLFAVLSANINDNELFIRLVICLYLTSFTMLYISSFKTKEEVQLISFKQTIDNIKSKHNNLIFTKEIKEVISYSFNTLLNILGIIILFSIPCNIIDNISLNNMNSNLLKGILEFSMPSIKLSLMKVNKKRIVLYLSTILSFSSFSSIMQASLFINEANLDTKQFIKNRILIAIITPILLYLLLSFF